MWGAGGACPPVRGSPAPRSRPPRVAKFAKSQLPWEPGRESQALSGKAPGWTSDSQPGIGGCSPPPPMQSRASLPLPPRRTPNPSQVPPLETVPLKKKRSASWEGGGVTLARVSSGCPGPRFPGGWGAGGKMRHPERGVGRDREGRKTTGVEWGWEKAPGSGRRRAPGSQAGLAVGALNPQLMSISGTRK